VPSTAILLLAFLFLPRGAGAQIVNTLRGFEEQKLAWSGALEGSVAAADGNTDYFQYELGASVQHISERNRWRLLGRGAGTARSLQPSHAEFHEATSQ
jgi:hypothetical protein